MILEIASGDHFVCDPVVFTRSFYFFRNSQNSKKYIDFYLNNYNVGICLLSDIFKYEDLNPNYKNIIYNVIVKTRNDNYGGTTIAFRKKVKQIKFSTDYDIVIVQSTNLSKNITIRLYSSKSPLSVVQK